MLHLALSEADGVELRAILEGTIIDLRREIAHTDARRFRDELKHTASTIERLLGQLSRQLASHGNEPVESAIAGPVGDYLREHVVDYAVIHHSRAYTALREAAAAHVPGREWAKAVVCMADDQPTLAVVPADHLVDLQRLRELAGAREMRLATEAEISVIYRSCEPGAMPPLGPLYGQRVFVDETMASNVEIAFSAGSHTQAIRMRFRDFERLVHPTVGRFGLMH